MTEEIKKIKEISRRFKEIDLLDKKEAK